MRLCWKKRIVKNTGKRNVMEKFFTRALTNDLKNIIKIDNTSQQVSKTLDKKDGYHHDDCVMVTVLGKTFNPCSASLCSRSV